MIERKPYDHAKKEQGKQYPGILRAFDLERVRFFALALACAGLLLSQLHLDLISE